MLERERNGAALLVIGVDSRKTREVESRLLMAGLVGEVPTKFISGCVLIIMKRQESDRLGRMTC